MSKPNILEKNPITYSEVKSIMKNIKKRDEELSFRGQKVEDYINHVAVLSKTQSQELKKKINEMEIPRLKNEHTTKIIDIMPKSLAELKVILQGYTVTVSSDNLKKIMGVVKEYLPKKK